MGAPSTEIVLNELAALAEVDTATLTRISDRAARLTLIRVGTSGALQRNTTLGTSIISSHGVGVDSTAWFYGSGVTKDPLALELARFVDTQLDLALEGRDPSRGKIHAYGALADGEVVTALRDVAQEFGVDHSVGATFTASGFFAPQGRDVSRIAPSVSDLDRRIAHDPRFLNMDMETAFVLHFCGALGYRAGAVCVAAANRERDILATDIDAHVEDAVRVALSALARMSTPTR
jgi:uridine phosphorylase